MNALVQALGWALLHSLWQGALVALGVGLLLWLLRHARPNMRYLVSCAGLFLLPICLIATTLVVPQDGSSESVTAEDIANAEDFASDLPPQVATGDTSPTPGSAWTATSMVSVADTSSTTLPTATYTSQSVWLFVKSTLPWLVAAWLLGVVVQAAWQLGGWLKVRALCRRDVQPVSDMLARRATEIAAKLGVRQTVQLWESAQASVPAVMGTVRPVILLPASVLTGLSGEQLDAVLAHELAHVRRYDYLVNLLQVAAETLLFYHPAAWWLGRKIRCERENCCDDVALEFCRDRLFYARTLTRLEEIRGGQPSPTLAAAATGPSQGTLLGRVRRILGKDEPVGQMPGARLGAALALLVALGLAVTYSLASAFPPEELPQKSPASAEQQINQAPDDAAPSNTARAQLPPKPRLQPAKFPPIDLNRDLVVLQFTEATTEPAAEQGRKPAIYGVTQFPMGETPSPSWIFHQRAEDKLSAGAYWLAGFLTHQLYGVGNPDGAELEVAGFTRLGNQITLRFRHTLPKVGAKFVRSSVYFSARLPELPAGKYQVTAVVDDFVRAPGLVSVPAGTERPRSIPTLACEVTVPNRETAARLKALAQQAIGIKPESRPLGSSDQNSTGLENNRQGELQDAIASSLDVANPDHKIEAAVAMLEKADPNTVPELLAAAKRNNYGVEGSENATIHSIYRRRLKEALEKITRLPLTPTDLQYFTIDRNGERKLVRSADSPEQFPEEVNFDFVEDWLRYVYLPGNQPPQAAAPPADDASLVNPFAPNQPAAPAVAQQPAIDSAPHPEFAELAKLLGQPNDAPAVQAFVKAHALDKISKGPSGSFSSEDYAYSLLFRDDRISTITLRVDRYPDGYGEANWRPYSRELPGGLTVADTTADVIRKLGQPVNPNGDRWHHRGLEIWVMRGENRSRIGELFVSAVEAEEKQPDEKQPDQKKPEEPKSDLSKPEDPDPNPAPNAPGGSREPQGMLLALSKPEQWSEPVAGLQIALVPRPGRGKAIDDIVLEVFLRNAGPEDLLLYQHRYNIYDYYPYTTFEVTRPDGQKFTLTKPATLFDEWDYPNPINLPKDATWGVGFRVQDWGPREGKPEQPFSLPGKYEVRAIYTLNLPRSKAWSGKVVSPPATFTLGGE